MSYPLNGHEAEDCPERVALPYMDRTDYTHGDCKSMATTRYTPPGNPKITTDGDGNVSVTHRTNYQEVTYTGKLGNTEISLEREEMGRVLDHLPPVYGQAAEASFTLSLAGPVQVTSVPVHAENHMVAIVDHGQRCNCGCSRCREGEGGVRCICDRCVCNEA